MRITVLFALFAFALAACGATPPADTTPPPPPPDDGQQVEPPAETAVTLAGYFGPCAGQFDEVTTSTPVGQEPVVEQFNTNAWVGDDGVMYIVSVGPEYSIHMKVEADEAGQVTISTINSAAPTLTGQITGTLTAEGLVAGGPVPMMTPDQPALTMSVAMTCAEEHAPTAEVQVATEDGSVVLFETNALTYVGPADMTWAPPTGEATPEEVPEEVPNE